jgi:hypothetical protein
MRKKAIVAVLLALLLSAALYGERQKPKNTMFAATASYHMEIRGSALANGFDLVAAYDFLLFPDPAIYLGLRGGLYLENVLIGYYLPGEIYTHYSAGVEALCVLPFVENNGLVLGVVIDLLAGDEYDPIYLYCAGKVGWRQFIMKNIDLEIDFEPGVFPFFNPIAIFLKAGVQIGFHI